MCEYEKLQAKCSYTKQESYCVHYCGLDAGITYLAKHMPFLQSHAPVPMYVATEELYLAEYQNKV